MSSSVLEKTFSDRSEGLKATATLNNGVLMPWFGLGVWQIHDDKTTREVVSAALSEGYRSVDTAALYRNEQGVGQGIRASGVARKDLFITTKVWNDDVRQDRVEAAFEQSLQLLGLDYVDLYLVHWPVKGKIVESWKAVEKIYRTGRARAIGVSNFMVPHLQELLISAEILPTINQIELHPYLQSRSLWNFCREHKIQMEAWSPLMQGGSILKEPVLAEIAKVHGKTVAQIILRWDVQSGIITIPKSVRPERIRENSEIFDFSLTDSEMERVNALERGNRSGADPMNFNF